jgi:hypothetical protein
VEREGGTAPPVHRGTPRGARRGRRRSCGTAAGRCRRRSGERSGERSAAIWPEEEARSIAPANVRTGVSATGGSGRGRRVPHARLPRGSCQLGTESDGGGEVASRRDGVGTVGRTVRGGGAGVSSDSWISRGRLDLFSLKIVDMQYCFFITQMGAKHPTNCLYCYRWYTTTRRSKRNENYKEVM